MTIDPRQERPSADGLIHALRDCLRGAIPLAEREARFAFVAPGGSPATAWIKLAPWNHGYSAGRVIAVLPSDFEQVPERFSKVVFIGPDLKENRDSWFLSNCPEDGLPTYSRSSWARLRERRGSFAFMEAYAIY